MVSATFKLLMWHNVMLSKEMTMSSILACTGPLNLYILRVSEWQVEVIELHFSVVAPAFL